MDELLRRAWAPIFQLYAKNVEPDWTSFDQRFNKYTRRVEMHMEDLTAEDLQRTLSRQTVRSAAGMDGWRVSELKALPLHLLVRLADLLNEVERFEVWPSALERSLISLIPKGERGEPLAMRPISVASAVYRLWAATRLQDAVRWQEGWIHEGQHSFRPKHGAIDVYWALALRVEEALLSGQPQDSC